MPKTDFALFAEMIRNRIPADELGKDFGLKVGRDGRCRCIFCDGERGDTLRLYPGQRGYFCFRCHEHGDVISLYQKLTGAGFRQAIEDLNEQYGIGLPLHNSDKAAMEKAKAESERRRREREEKKRRENQLYSAYLDVADAVWILEYHREHNAPQTKTEPWKQRFVISLRYLDELRDLRDRLYDEWQRML